jgi:hypothetical protein
VFAICVQCLDGKRLFFCLSATLFSTYLLKVLVNAESILLNSKEKDVFVNENGIFS